MRKRINTSPDHTIFYGTRDGDPTSTVIPKLTPTTRATLTLLDLKISAGCRGKPWLNRNGKCSHSPEVRPRTPRTSQRLPRGGGIGMKTDFHQRSPPLASFKSNPLSSSLLWLEVCGGVPPGRHEPGLQPLEMLRQARHASCVVQHLGEHGDEAWDAMKWAPGGEVGGWQPAPQDPPGPRACAISTAGPGARGPWWSGKAGRSPREAASLHPQRRPTLPLSTSANLLETMPKTLLVDELIVWRICCNRALLFGSTLGACVSDWEPSFLLGMPFTEAPASSALATLARWDLPSQIPWAARSNCICWAL